MTPRIRILTTAVVFCLPAFGCRLTHNALLTTVIEPAQYPRNVYDKTSHHRFAKFAACALEEARAVAKAEADDYQCPPFTPDHEAGFIDGYVDYLESGGTGDPPVLPPRRYWRAKYQTPSGKQSVHDWFAGYSHGASAAMASNRRSLVTVAISDDITSSTLPYAYGRVVPVSQLTPDPDGNSPGIDGQDDEGVRYAQLPDAEARASQPDAQPGTSAADNSTTANSATQSAQPEVLQ
jgi:hypothetical protein